MHIYMIRCKNDLTLPYIMIKIDKDKDLLSNEVYYNLYASP